MKRPLLMVTLCYGSGVIAADFAPGPLPFFPVIGITFLLVVTALAWDRFRTLLLACGLFMTGVTNLTLHQVILSPNDVREIFADEPQIVEARGVLCETPSLRIYEHDGEETLRTLAEMDLKAVRTPDGKHQTAFGRLLITTSGRVGTNFFGGQSVLLEGVLSPPRQPVAEELFNYRKFLARRGVYFQLQVASPNDWRLASESPGKAKTPLADRFGAWARGALSRGLPEEDQTLHLLWAMTLGWKTAFNGEVAEPFMRSGTMHVFAISGLHIALIAGLLVMALRVVRIPRVWCGAIVVPLIWQYTALTGWQASAVRSTIMMTVVIAGWSLRRPSDLLNSLAAAAFIILLWDPQQLFQAGFQLSFFVVLSLALFTPVLDEIRQRCLAPDPFIPVEFLPRWRRWLGPGLHYLTSSMAVSLAAWLGSIPLIASYFHLFTPVSLLANLAVVPLSGAALASNLAGLATSSFVPGITELFNHSAWFFMWLMIKLSHWAAVVPGGCFYISSPSPAGYALYYGLLFGVMAGWFKRPKWRWWFSGALALVAVVWSIDWFAERGKTELTFLPLNGGQAVYVRPGHSSDDLLIDCGRESATGFVTKPFLRAKGVNALSRLVLTHGDIHHVGGASLIRDHFSPRQILVGSSTFRSGGAREILRDLESSRSPITKAHRGDRVSSWQVLHPDQTDRFSQADDNTVVLWGEFEGVRVLLLSDLGKPGQNALLSRYPELRADIVISGVPVQSEPLADAFLDVISPQAIVLVDSDYPATQRAPRKVQERLTARGTPTFVTRNTGAVYLSIQNGSWTLRTNRGEQLSGSSAKPTP